MQTGRVDVFGEGEGHARRGYLVYSGIHYDPVVFSSVGARVARDRISVVPVGHAGAASAARALGEQLRGQGKFSDRATLRLRCKTCGAVVEGDYAARLHSGTLGHRDFAPA